MDRDVLGRTSWLTDPLGSGIAVFAYDVMGMAGGIGRPGANTGHWFTGAGRLISLSHYFAAGLDVLSTFDHNPAGQIVTRYLSNDAYAWQGHYAVNRPYTTNGLNQYSAAGGAAFGYDANGNLTSEPAPGGGTRTYTYDVENRLVGASGGLVLTYDPLGRLWRTAGGASGTTTYLYDGDALVAEYSASGTLAHRYVHGDGADDPLVRYDSSSTAAADRINLLADHQGSIIATSDNAANRLSINRYDEYGIPAAGNTGRFQYTGQIWLPDLGMYYYKARVYSPYIGRFLQTDPVGYKDQYNLYAYVGNDPVNRVDPTGLQGVLTIYANPDHVWITYQADGADEPTSFGRFSEGSGGGLSYSGVHVNVERRLNYGYSAMRQVRLNSSQELGLLTFIKRELGPTGWTFFDHCVHFLRQAWVAAGGEPFRNRWGFEYPVDVIRDIRELNGGANERRVPTRPRNRSQSGQSGQSQQRRQRARPRQTSTSGACVTHQAGSCGSQLEVWN